MTQNIKAINMWDELVLQATYHQGLNTNILTKLACRDNQACLDSLIGLSVHLHPLLRNRVWVNMDVNPAQEPHAVEPMQLDHVRLTPLECQKHQ